MAQNKVFDIDAHLLRERHQRYAWIGWALPHTDRRELIGGH